MKKLIKLTQVHPELNGGQPYSVYIDRDHIMVIERGGQSHRRGESEEAYRVSMLQLYEEVERVNAEAAGMPKTMAPENEKQARQADRWLMAKEAAASLQAAYQMVSHALRGPAYYPKVECTVVQLSCGTAFEHGVMLARIFVNETPEEVVRLMEIG